MVNISDIPPLLIPNPQKVDILDGKFSMGKFPLGITGISEDKITAVNDCITNLFSVSINEDLFNIEKKSPKIAIQINQDLTEHFKDIKVVSITSFNLNEAYVIIIGEQVNLGKEQISIAVGSDEAIQHALFTLAQLINQYGKILPAMIIKDIPVFPNRGFMLDISRDRVPTMEEFYSLIDTLAFLKYNHLQLYTEHTFAYKNHERVWKDASPLTADEIKAIDTYCRLLGITLSANQACFTHLTRWLKHDKYARLAETKSDWDGTRFSDPFSLNPNEPASLDLVSDMLGQLIPNFSSKLVNINCDEAIDLGAGASKDVVLLRGSFAIYWEFVSKIFEIVRKHNFRPMIWADMWLNAPKNERKELDDDVIALIWGYEPNAPFASSCQELSAFVREVWVCPGTSCWRSISGRTNERRANIVEAALQGLSNGAKGYLLTEWGDAGHRQQYPITLYALAEASQTAWSACQAAINGKAISFQLFGDRQEMIIADWMARLGNLDVEIRQTSMRKKDNGQVVPLINATCLFMEMESAFDSDRLNGTLNEWSRVAVEHTNLSNEFSPLNNEKLNDEFLHILKVSEFAIKKAILRRVPKSKQQRGLDNLVTKMKKINDEHRRLWLARSRPGGLEDSCMYYNKVLEDLVESAKPKYK